MLPGPPRMLPAARALADAGPAPEPAGAEAARASETRASATATAAASAARPLRPAPRRARLVTDASFCRRMRPISTVLFAMRGRSVQSGRDSASLESHRCCPSTMAGGRGSRSRPGGVLLHVRQDGPRSFGRAAAPASSRQAPNAASRCRRPDSGVRRCSDESRHHRSDAGFVGVRGVGLAPRLTAARREDLGRLRSRGRGRVRAINSRAPSSTDRILVQLSDSEQ